MRINEITKELGMNNKEVLAKAHELGIDAKSHSSGISDSDAVKLKAALSPESKKKTDTTKSDGKPKITKLSPEPLPAASKARPQGTREPQKGATNVAGNTPLPKRIPKDQATIPKRIPKAEVERAKAEEAKANEFVDLDNKSSEGTNTDTDKPTAPRKKIELKVARKDTDPDRPLKTINSRHESKKNEKSTKTTSQEITETQKEQQKPATKVEDKQDSPQGSQLKSDVPEGTQPKTVDRPHDKSDSPQNAQNKRAQNKGAQNKGTQNKGTQSKGTQSKGTQNKGVQESRTGRPQGAQDPRTAKAKPAATGDKPKDKPKKGNKGKKKEEYNEFNAKKKNPRQKSKGLVDDFKGSSKRPILEDNLLEKKTVRSKARPRKQIVEQEPENVIVLEELAPGTVVINVPITVKGFAEQIKKTSSDVIMALMKMGVMANVNQNIDEDTVLLLAEELGVPVIIGKDEGEIIEEGLETFDDKPEDLVTRPPIITVMGHVDHGKTSLLDKIRETDVTKGEAGGITQHIGASEITFNGKRIVFLDTPGHEAFTAMRARGAHVTDIAILVVAADDGVKPQTIESISHAKAAGVPIIVAINKIDKPGADPDRVKKDLSEHGILVEDWGGDTISVPVSAKSGEGIQDLLEMVLLQAEVLELKANPTRLGKGTVIEARLDKAKGVVATLLVLNGTLDTGMSIVAGTTSGRIKAMTDNKGKKLKSAGPATAVEVLGLDEVPQAGDQFNEVGEDRIAREIAENRRLRQREEVMTRKAASASLESLFEQIQTGEIKELNLIIKGDVQGSVGALTTSLEKLKNENVQIKIIHTGVGTVTESDVMLATTSGAIIIGFNVRPSVAISNRANRDGVEIRTYRIIYDVINDIEDAMEGMLDPEFKEVVLGQVEVRETFKVPNIGTIGGAYVTDGVIQRNAEVRLIRDGIVIHEGKISSLKRFKDDVKEVAQGYECGIGIENYNDIKIGDVIEAFKMEEVKRGN